jgi:hypothetical protein
LPDHANDNLVGMAFFVHAAAAAAAEVEPQPFDFCVSNLTFYSPH